MGISSLMGKLHHKEGEAAPAPMPVPRPPAPRVEEATKQPNAQIHEQSSQKRWGSPGVSNLRDDEGIILDIGEGMSINLPIKKRMSLDDFLKIAERVKRIEELNIGQPSYNEHMSEYH